MNKLILLIFFIILFPFCSAIDQQIKIVENVSFERGVCSVVEEYSLSSGSSEKFNESYLWMSIPKPGTDIDSIVVSMPSNLQVFMSDSDPYDYYIFVNQNAPIISLDQPINYSVSYIRNNCTLGVRDKEKLIPLMKTVRRLGIDQEFNIKIKPIDLIINLEYDPNNISISYLGFPVADIYSIPTSNVRLVSDSPLSFEFLSKEGNNLYSFLYVKYRDINSIISITQRDNINLEEETITRSPPSYFSLSNKDFFYMDSKDKIRIYSSEEPQKYGKKITYSPSLDDLAITPREKISLNKNYCGLKYFPFRCIDYKGIINFSNELPIGKDYPAVDINYFLDFKELKDLKLVDQEPCFKYEETSFLGGKSEIKQKEFCEDQRISILLNKSIKFISPILMNNSLTIEERKSTEKTFDVLLDPGTIVSLYIKARLIDHLYYKLEFFGIIAITCVTCIVSYNKSKKSKKKIKSSLYCLGVGFVSGLVGNLFAGSPEHYLAFPIVAPLIGLMLSMVILFIMDRKKKSNPSKKETESLNPNLHITLSN